MSEWVKRGKATSIENAIVSNSGVSAAALRGPKMENPQNIPSLYEAAAKLSSAIIQKTPITIVGDYDSDGLNATAILIKLCNYYSVTPRAIIPRRMSDGYGLSDNIVNKIEPGCLVITIDNGITAVDQVAALKAKGCAVVIMDHHLPGETIPAADVVVDPHTTPNAKCFKDYCGAGLGLQLAWLMLTNDHSRAGTNLLKELVVHAAIATVTDVMPMVGVNRRIVMDGLHYINDPILSKVCGGLAAIRMAAKAEVVNEETIGYRIGPLLNAPARLYDNGGASVLKALVCNDFSEGSDYAVKMMEINQTRKALVKQHTQTAKAKVLETVGDGPMPNPIVICMDDVAEGVLGIIASQIAGAFRRSAFVFTRMKDQNGQDLYKGSARAYGSDDLSPILDAVRPLTVSCGGHIGAAGLTVTGEYMAAVRDTLQEVGLDHAPENETIFYDLEATIADIPGMVQEQTLFAPFGYGVEKPKLLIRGVTPDIMSLWGNSHYRLIGEDRDSLKFSAAGVDIVGFGLAKKYADLGNPTTFDILCTIGANTFNGRTTAQVSIIDIRT